MGGSKGGSSNGVLSVVLVHSSEGRGESFVYFSFMFKVELAGLVLLSFSDESLGGFEVAFLDTPDLFGGREKLGPSKVSIGSGGFAAFSNCLCFCLSGSTSDESCVILINTLQSSGASI